MSQGPPKPKESIFLKTLKNLHLIPTASSILADEQVTVVEPSKQVHSCALPPYRLGIAFQCIDDIIVVTDIQEDSDLYGILSIGDTIVGVDEFAFDARNVAFLLETLREREGKPGRMLHFQKAAPIHLH